MASSTVPRTAESSKELGDQSTLGTLKCKFNIVRDVAVSLRPSIAKLVAQGLARRHHRSTSRQDRIRRRTALHSSFYVHSRTGKEERPSRCLDVWINNVRRRRIRPLSPFSCRLKRFPTSARILPLLPSCCFVFITIYFLIIHTARIDGHEPQPHDNLRSTL